MLHGRDDHVVPIEQGRMMAAQIPGSRFVMPESGNHVPLPDEPAWATLMKEIEAFAMAAD